MTLLPWRALVERKSPASRPGKLRRPGLARRTRLGMETLEDRCVPATVFWTNPSGGDWDTGANWSTGTKPGVSDDAVIDTTGITVAHNQNQTDAVNSLTSRAALTIGIGTLSLASASAITSALTLNNGTLTGAGTVTVSGPLTWSGGTMSGSFTKVLDTRTLNNAGAATWSGTGGVECDNVGTFNNLAGASFDDQANNTVWLQVVRTGGSFNNAGTFTTSAPTSFVTFGVAFNDTGTVDVRQGSVTLTGGGSFGGDFAIQGGRVNMMAGTVTFPDGAAGTGTGTLVVAFGATATVGPGASASLQNLSLGGGTLTGAGTLTVNGLLAWGGGTMSGTGVTNSDGGLTLTGGTLDTRTLNNAGAATWNVAGVVQCVNAGTFNNLAGASFDDQVDGNWRQASGAGGRFTNAGTFTKSADTATFSVTFTNSGTLTVAPDSTLAVAGTYSQTGTATVQDTGTLTLRGPFSNFKNGNTLTRGAYDILGTFQFIGANVVINKAVLTLDGPDAQVVDENGNDGLANLARNAAGASLTVQNGAGLTTVGDFTDRGTVTVGAGSTVTVGGTYTETTGVTTLGGGTLAAGMVSVRRGGTLSGIGTVNASVRNAGQVLVGTADTTGVLTITGDFTQTAAGSLTLAVGGLTVGTEYDQLAIGGTAALDGTLNVSLVSGFAPPSGSTYEILTFAAAGGSFTTLDIDPSFLPPVYDPTDVTLQAT